MKENRKHTRLPLELPAEIKLSNGAIYKGGIKNISFGGVFLDMPDLTELKQGNKCKLSVILQEELKRLSIDFDCEVIHVQSSGIGLRFIAINGTEAYNHFKNLMVMNSPDPDQLLEELERHPGLILQDK
ncbi:PilZ domain-containing protein [Candidatus Magnetomoraceae bacterium gMMP-15]